MKNNSFKKNDEFRSFKTKIFTRTLLLAVISTLFIYFLYSFVLYGKFANGMIALLQVILRLKYASAYALYEHIFREHISFFIFIAVVSVFFIVFRIYLNWFSNYFREINKGIDTLIDEQTGDIVLSAELSAIEKKINTVKHTLIKQKLDAQLAEQGKNDLIMYLAHDLKTPLASVIGYLNLLHDETEISESLREKYLSISLEKAEHLEDLINEFFEIAKFHLSNITLHYGTINLTRLLEMLLYEFQPMLQEKQLTCRLAVPETILLQCDGDKMQRVFDNLLRNAVLYSYTGTEITISADRQADHISILFTNHGSTIPPDKLERIFEQFYRLDASRSSAGGAGLGLAIAKQIVTLHNGAITAKSEDECTTFTVTLPLS